MTPRLTGDAKTRLDTLLANTTHTKRFPAIFLGVTSAEGEIYYNQSGEVVFDQPDSGQVNANTVTELFSQTKFITCIAALQLVDRQLLSLDSVEDVQKYLPEIAQLRILEGYNGDSPNFARPKTKPTLRMLMSHSAGLVYPAGQAFLKQWLEHNPVVHELNTKAILADISAPLFYEPGTSWRYSCSIDWVGVLITRVTGMSLEEYIQQNISKPCGADSFTFYPTEDVKKRKMAFCEMDAKGKVRSTKTGFGWNRPTEVEGVSKDLLSGGAGLFGSQKDFLAVLREVLRSDPEYTNRPSRPLLSPESFAEVFKPSIASGKGQDGCERICDMLSVIGYHDAPTNPALVNHSVACYLDMVDIPGRRKATSGSWSGAGKTQFWIDPVSGIAAVCGTQLLSEEGLGWFEFYAEFETEVYAGLE